MRNRIFKNGSSNHVRSMEIEDYVLTATEKEAARLEPPLERKWIDSLWFFVVFIMLVLAGRILFMTVIKGSYYQDIAKGNSVRSLVIKAPRGRIYDRFGIPLVTNVPSMDLVVIPFDLPRDEGKKKEIALKVAEVTNMNEADVRIRIENMDPKSFNPVLIKENISQEEALIISEQAENLPGIHIEKTAIREYADSKIFSHVLGYEGKIERKEFEENKGYLFTDYIGKQGIEKSYENELRGVHGALQTEVDSMGNPKREIGIINPKPGGDVMLSLDAALQKKLYDTINSALETTKTKTAAAVAIDPRNGEVLAMVNIPSYDNNLFARKISQDDYVGLINDPDKPLFNRSVAGAYPPGSTVKPAISAAALSEGVINQNTIIDGLGGVLRIGNFSYGDWKAHGPSDVRTAIAESNDIFFYTIGGGYGSIEGLGINRMKKYYNMFGFGQLSGVDIPGEVSGLIPDEQWKLDKIKEKWYVGNSYHAAIGQGYVTATPIQIANYIAAVANGGTLFKPHLVKEIKKGTGETVPVKSEIIREGFVSPEIMRIAQEGMRKTITDGTAQTLKELPVEAAGKTGTAQFGTEDKTHAWFVSYAPYENPEIAMVVLVEGGGEGHSSAVPVTRDVYAWYFGGRN